MCVMTDPCDCHPAFHELGTHAPTIRVSPETYAALKAALDEPPKVRPRLAALLAQHAPTNPAATVSQGKAVRRRGTTLARLRRWFKTWPFHADEMCG
jgi:hypothetical protein